MNENQDAVMPRRLEQIVQPFNNLSLAEAERLAWLLEEIGEVQQAIGKILRHGYENYHPEFPGIRNRQDLEREVAHVYAALDLMVAQDDIDLDNIRPERNEKAHKVKKWLHHQ